MISNINLNDKSKVIPIKEYGLSETEVDKIYLPEKCLSMKKEEFLENVVIIENRAYYLKYANIINELIGSFLAKKINLPSVDYQIGVYENELYALSELFYNKDFEYFYPEDYLGFKMIFKKKFRPNFVTDIYYFKNKLSQFDDNLLNELLKLIALDLKMGQVDRHGHNLMFQKNLKDGLIDLAPVYDYSNSYAFFEKPFKYYRNVYLLIRNNKQSIKSLVKKYPQIIEYFAILKELSMEEILAAIEKEKNIEIKPSEKEYRIAKDKEYTKILKML